MIKIEKVIPGGQSLGTNKGGKKVFFWNALPGEIIEEYSITKQKSHYEEAIATKIQNQSPYRVTPLDTCYLSTSPWQIIDYNYELRLKQELVTEIFHEHHIDIDTPEIATDNKDYHYRNKMEYALYWNHTLSQIQLAFRQRGTHRKIPISKSSIERPEIFQAANEIIKKLNSRHEEARKYQTLLLRCNQQGKTSGGLYENHQPHPLFPHLTDKIMGREFSYSPNGFFQINLPVYEMALTEIKKHIATNTVLDLYAGVGTIGLSVASDRHLTLVESDKYAFSEMVKNITTGANSTSDSVTNSTNHSEQQTNQAQVRNGNILAVLDKSENVTNYISHNQTVILDPPRAGCDKKLIEELLTLKPTKIIYLSCNPATQARDVKLLLEYYRIEVVKTFNFFPHTPHIENLVILSL